MLFARDRRSIALAAALAAALVVAPAGARARQAAPAAPAAIGTAASAAPSAHLVTVKDLPVLRLKGSPHDMGFQHGQALAPQIKEGIDAFVLKHRCGNIRVRYEQIVKRVEREIAFPDEIVAELHGMLEGMRAAAIDLSEPILRRDLALIDLEVLNTLDHWGLFGCSGFTAWGRATKDGDVLAARNFDFDVDDAHAIARLGCVFAFEPTNAKAFVSLSFPGLIGVVTGVNDDGVAAFVHVANGAYGAYGGDADERTVPLLFITRRILEDCGPAEAAPAARELLKGAHLRNSFLLRIVTPGGDAPPTTIFELDSNGFAEEALPDAAKGEPTVLVATNHFCGREAQFKIPDSNRRFCILADDVKQWLDGGDHVIDADEAWHGLGNVAQETVIQTLHSLVLVPKRRELWISLSGVSKKTNEVIASTRRPPSHVTLDELFARD